MNIAELAKAEFEEMSDEARADAASGNWDEVMADRANARLPKGLSGEEWTQAAQDLQWEISAMARAATSAKS